jgi:hypothetical protein
MRFWADCRLSSLKVRWERSSIVVNAIGHIVSSSRFAWSLKSNVPCIVPKNNSRNNAHDQRSGARRMRGPLRLYWLPRTAAPIQSTLRAS